MTLVNPRNTSSICPICDGKLASNGYGLLRYRRCGYERDRDVIACSPCTLIHIRS
ncbi:MAG: zinc ribbon domain-containing protein [Candidatus Asgardarchaeia archaeon]